MHQSHYKGLIPMSILSFITMYVLMFAMVDKTTNVFLSLNQFYMAGLMTAPMIIIELIVMSAMYTDKRKNVIIAILSTIATFVFFLLIRTQTAIDDKEFLKSMIPHHAGALLMCQKTNAEDPDIKQLCQNIIKDQQREIDFMKEKLHSID